MLSRLWKETLEAAPGFGPGMMDLQSTALPLGYAATKESIAFRLKRVKKNGSFESCFNRTCIKCVSNINQL